MNTLFGINNCDTVKKAQRWLKEHDVEYQFHDFRKDGLTHRHIENWLKTINPEQLVNKRSTTWKQLDESSKAQLLDFTGNLAASIEILAQNPTVIKRPLLALPSGNIAVGFKVDEYQTLFGSS